MRSSPLASRPQGPFRYRACKICEYGPAGLITTKRAELEDKQAVIVRIQEAAKYVPLENLCLSPQCGFASCEIGNKLTEEQQWAKVALVREIAEEVWGYQSKCPQARRTIITGDAQITRSRKSIMTCGFFSLESTQPDAYRKQTSSESQSATPCDKHTAR